MSPKYDLIKGNGFAFDGYDKYWNNIHKILETCRLSSQIKIPKPLDITWKYISYFNCNISSSLSSNTVNPIVKYKKLIFYGCTGNAMKKNGTRDYWGLISFQDYLRLSTKMYFFVKCWYSTCKAQKYLSRIRILLNRFLY